MGYSITILKSEAESNDLVPSEKLNGPVPVIHGKVDIAENRVDTEPETPAIRSAVNILHFAVLRNVVIPGAEEDEIVVRILDAAPVLIVGEIIILKQARKAQLACFVQVCFVSEAHFHDRGQLCRGSLHEVEGSGSADVVDLAGPEQAVPCVFHLGADVLHDDSYGQDRDAADPVVLNTH